MGTRIESTERTVDIAFDYEPERSDVRAEFEREGTLVQVGDVRLYVTGRTGGFRATLAFRGETLWNGVYDRAATGTDEAPF